MCVCVYIQAITSLLESAASTKPLLDEDGRFNLVRNSCAQVQPAVIPFFSRAHPPEHVSAATVYFLIRSCICCFVRCRRSSPSCFLSGPGVVHLRWGARNLKCNFCLLLCCCSLRSNNFSTPALLFVLRLLCQSKREVDDAVKLHRLIG